METTWHKLCSFCGIPQGRFSRSKDLFWGLECHAVQCLLMELLKTWFRAETWILLLHLRSWVSLAAPCWQRHPSFQVIAHRGVQISCLSPHSSDALQVLQGHREEAPGHLWVCVPGEAVMVQSKCQAQARICPGVTGHSEEETREIKEKLTFFNIRKTYLFLYPC